MKKKDPLVACPGDLDKIEADRSRWSRFHKRYLEPRSAGAVSAEMGH